MDESLGRNVHLIVVNRQRARHIPHRHQPQQKTTAAATIQLKSVVKEIARSPSLLIALYQTAHPSFTIEVALLRLWLVKIASHISANNFIVVDILRKTYMYRAEMR
ncbi:hypothetical protein FOPE_08401 [Fonsecaea pedrosoi]|nr:hypothetical protein FOPE_08401 [Fonsecaea pedrosoi]